MSGGRRAPASRPETHETHETIAPEEAMKGIVAWLMGVPIVVIILLYVFNIF
ncbi:hypothetical protein OU426_08080 [Frigidibacter sp. RF13]|uniref:hypothetical protein n=1 Tax=Frigidibacter sp. RF13 TaxID=2997340 RepID=UPI00226DC5AE|nr:hypothetical protein [Frigidibacter sp. RF13]MCY1126807.1 hypothetical protein [Frigidibacter sp. RF13]